MAAVQAGDGARLVRFAFRARQAQAEPLDALSGRRGVGGEHPNYLVGRTENPLAHINVEADRRAVTRL